MHLNSCDISNLWRFNFPPSLTDRHHRIIRPVAGNIYSSVMHTNIVASSTTTSGRLAKAVINFYFVARICIGRSLRNGENKQRALKLL